MRRPPPRFWSARRASALVGSFLALVTTAPAQEARPHEGGASTPLARFIPQKNLYFYAEFDGLDSHSTAWKKSAAYKILNETKFGRLLEDIARQGIEAARKANPTPGPQTPPAELIATIERIVQKGVAFAVLGMDKDETRALFVVRDGARKDVRALLDRLAVSISEGKGERKSVKKAGRSLTVFEGKVSVAVWDETGDTVLCDENHVDLVLAALDGKGPNMVKHPIRAALRKGKLGFDPVLIGFVEMAALPPLPPNAVKLGLDGLKRVELQWGFQDDALVSVLRFVAPAPRKGVIALLDQPTFDVTSLPPLPAGLTGFTVISAEPLKLYEQILALREIADPAAAERTVAGEQNLSRALGLDLRKDVLAHLGPKVAIYDGSAAGGAPSLILLGIPFLNLTIAAQTDDAEAVGKAVDALVKVVGNALKNPGPNNRRPPGAPAPEFRKLVGPHHGYILVLPPGAVPPEPLAFLMLIQPAVVVGKDQLIIAAKRDAAEDAAKLDVNSGRWTPHGAFAALGRRLPKKMVFLNVNDPRETFPALISNLPSLFQMVNAGIASEARRQAPDRRPRPNAGIPIEIDPNLVPQAGELAALLFPGALAAVTDEKGIEFIARESFPSVTSPGSSAVLIALLVPAVQAARDAARRAQCMNNLKSIGLALHDYENVNGLLPKAAITDQGGKPLLSWRVAILPYIGQQALYNKFKLDEPWDSPHNKQLLQSMPPTYACPSTPRPDPSSTTYQVFVGNGALFEVGREVGIRDITDGTSNTLMVVEGAGAIPWTKPDDLEFDPEDMNPTFGVGSPHPGGFNALFADGSVKFIKTSIDPTILRALITRAGNEIVPADAF